MVRTVCPTGHFLGRHSAVATSGMAANMKAMIGRLLILKEGCFRGEVLVYGSPVLNSEAYRRKPLNNRCNLYTTFTFPVLTSRIRVERMGLGSPLLPSKNDAAYALVSEARTTLVGFNTSYNVSVAPRRAAAAPPLRGALSPFRV